jgi:transposase
MTVNPSDEVKTRIVKSKQKNGDIYVLERKTLYDPKLKYNKVLSTKLLAKIPKGATEPVPTRPKKPDSKKLCKDEAGSVDSGAVGRSILSASRSRVGMINIIEHIGKSSGIDDALYAATDTGVAQKIISLARYLLATDGQSLPGILTWQFNHRLPYEDGLSEDIYHKLFRTVGYDETLQQSFFYSRCKDLHDGCAIAYDSTTLSTYSENQIEARYGFNKDHDGLKTIKYLSLYSLDTRQPLAFAKQPGNLPDVITVGSALEQLMALGVSKAELVTDNGYYSWQNLSELFSAGFRFITLAKPSLKWIREELERHAPDFSRLDTACPFDPATHAVTSVLMREFTKIRKYASKKAGLAAGDEETFRRRVYLHLYFNATRKADEDCAFDSTLLSIKGLLERSEPLSEAAQKKADKYLTTKKSGSSVRVGYNEKACAEAKRYHGYFALVSSSEKDAFAALAKYRKREHIEEYFRSAKQHADSTRARVWDADTLRGRMFVQFIALCYYEHLSEEVRKMKLSLGKETGDPEHDTKAVLGLEKKLKSWLDNTPLYLQLQWFDVVEGVEVSSKLRSRRLAADVTKRDALYLEKLGVSGEFG